MKILKIYCTVVLILLVSLKLFAQEEKKSFNFVGSSGCKACHISTKSGAAYKIWHDSKHAQSFTELASEKAQAIAKEKGIADPQKSDECLACHVTAFGVEAARLGTKYVMDEGVSCESCHGPGSEYKTREIMQGITAGTIDPVSVGLTAAREEDCKQCHNEKSPTYKVFDYTKMVVKIEHKIPEDKAVK